MAFSKYWSDKTRVKKNHMSNKLQFCIRYGSVYFREKVWWVSLDPGKMNLDIRSRSRKRDFVYFACLNEKGIKGKVTSPAPSLVSLGRACASASR